MAAMILIHGAWHGGWCWEQVVPLLEAKGHLVLAPDSPGLGDDRTPFAEDIFAQWVDAATQIIEAQRDQVILVGHSRGTTIVSAVAERVPDRVAHAIFLCGYMLADGEALADVKASSDAINEAVIPSADGTAVGLDPSQAANLLYGKCTSDAAARAVARLTDEPLQPAMVRLNLTKERFGRVPRSYIETSDDRGLPLHMQREAQTRWPCDRVVTLPSDHSPFYSMPERLAQVLDDLAGQPNPSFSERTN